MISPLNVAMLMLMRSCSSWMTRVGRRLDRRSDSGRTIFDRGRRSTSRVGARSRGIVALLCQRCRRSFAENDHIGLNQLAVAMLAILLIGRGNKQIIAR